MAISSIHSSGFLSSGWNGGRVVDRHGTILCRQSSGKVARQWWAEGRSEGVDAWKAAAGRGRGGGWEVG